MDMLHEARPDIIDGTVAIDRDGATCPTTTCVTRGSPAPGPTDRTREECATDLLNPGGRARTISFPLAWAS